MQPRNATLLGAPPVGVVPSPRSRDLSFWGFLGLECNDQLSTLCAAGTPEPAKGKAEKTTFHVK